MAEKLGREELATARAELTGWSVDEKAAKRSFKFKDFTEAFDFMKRVAVIVDKADHHPDWSNSYNTVEISLSTHDAGGLTQKDVSLARDISALV